MGAFRAFMWVVFVGIAAYTVVVVMDHGLNLFQVFFGDMLAMAWPGQFNFDFMCFLAMSAAWVVWRNNYSRTGWLLAVPAFLGGAFFLSAYLLYLSREADNLVEIMIGPQRIGVLKAAG